MKTTSTQRIVRFGLLKRILWGCLILIVQLIAVPSVLLAERCPGDPEDDDYLDRKIDCLREKLKYVSMDDDAGGKPILKITGASVRILPDGLGTGNLRVGSNNTFNESTAGFVSGDDNTISGYGATISGGKSNVARGEYVTISGGFENGEVEGALQKYAGFEYVQGERLASAVGGGHKNVAIGQADVVIGGTENKSLTHNYSTIMGGDGNIIGGEQGKIEGDGTTIIGGTINDAQDSYSVVVGGYRNEATGYASTSAGGNSDRSRADYATAIGGSGMARTSYSMIAGASGHNSTAGSIQEDTHHATNMGGYISYANGSYATVCGGRHGAPSGEYSTVSGGYKVLAMGPYSSSTGGVWYGNEGWGERYTNSAHAFTAGADDVGAPPLLWPSDDGPCAGICDDAVQLNRDQNVNIGTDELCIERTDNIDGGTCGNLGNRTLTVNGAQMTCDWQIWSTVPSSVDGGYCIHVTAGDNGHAGYALW